MAASQNTPTKSKRCQFLIDSLNSFLSMPRLTSLLTVKSLQVVRHKNGDNSLQMCRKPQTPTGITAPCSFAVYGEVLLKITILFKLIIAHVRHLFVVICPTKAGSVGLSHLSRKE